MAHPLLERLFSSSLGDDDGRSSLGRRPAAASEPGYREPQPDDPRVERVRLGDPNIFAELYGEYFADLSAFAFRYVRDSGIAEDIVHDVFLKLWSFRANIEIRTTLRAYLFGMVANRARDAASQLRRDSAIFSPLSSEDDSVSGHSQVAAHSPHDTLESSDIRKAVMAAVATLPERQRLALTLRLSNDMTYDEIATVLGITKSSVAELITKAQIKLRLLLHLLLS